MQPDDLYSVLDACCEKYRPGRDIGSGLGKTSGRGHKGLTSCSGDRVTLGFGSGRQLPHRCLSKLGFVSPRAMDRAGIRTSGLARIGGDVTSLQTLKDTSLISQHTQRVRAMLSGEVDHAVTLKGVAITKDTCVATKTAGGRFED